MPPVLVWLCVAWLGAACSSTDDQSTTNAASGGSGGTGEAGWGSGGDQTATGGTNATGGTVGSGGNGGSGGSAGQQVDLDDIGTPCDDGGECPPGLSPVEFCGIAGCSPVSFCTCEIPCDGDPSVCPPGTTCFNVSDGPGDVCHP